MSNFEDVKTFMKRYGQEIKTKPKFPNQKIVDTLLDKFPSILKFEKYKNFTRMA